jgi:hypothetical protein
MILIVFLETVVTTVVAADNVIEEEQSSVLHGKEAAPLRSVITLLMAVAVLVAMLVVVGAVFGLAVGKEYLCHGLMKAAEHGVNIATLLGGYCT